jgi:hypothetical protein
VGAAVVGQNVETLRHETVSEAEARFAVVGGPVEIDDQPAARGRRLEQPSAQGEAVVDGSPAVTIINEKNLDLDRLWPDSMLSIAGVDDVGVVGGGIAGPALRDARGGEPALILMVGCSTRPGTGGNGAGGCTADRLRLIS